jgi:hypothetical protein
MEFAGNTEDDAIALDVDTSAAREHNFGFRSSKDYIIEVVDCGKAFIDREQHICYHTYRRNTEANIGEEGIFLSLSMVYFGSPCTKPVRNSISDALM